MSRNEEIQDDWHDSQPGDVGHLVHRLQDRRRARATQQRTVVAVLVLMIAFTGYYFVGVLPEAEPNFGGIVCSRVHDLMPQYMANSLDAATSGQIRQHLNHCRNCGKEMTKMKPVSRSAIKPSSSQVAVQTDEPRRNFALPASSERFASLSR